ncbi:hypothetical protein TWF694_003031 [Orbilia ellipsospora]|uniref:Uncharacterized protein n=1 Tax=Orbilia ellipsospora TaxID=2528407 RepID=A0AAV9X1J6_9PEZI
MKSLFSLAFLLLQAHALVFNYNDSSLSNDDSNIRGRDTIKLANLVPRADEGSYCSPPTIDVSPGTRKNRLRRQARANVYGAQSPNPAQLWRRMYIPMTQNTNFLSEWITTQVGLTGVENNIVIKNDGNPRIITRPQLVSDFGITTWRPFARETTEFSLAASRLCGCTSLLIFNHVGVFFTHWWESVSFQVPPLQAFLDIAGAIDHNDLFQKTVIDGLHNGYHPVPGSSEMDQVSLAGAPAAAFLSDTANLKAYFFRPSTESIARRNQDYQAEWDSIKSTVMNILQLPSTVNAGWWNEVEYDALNPIKDKERLANTGAGKILFKYDPKDTKKFPEKEPQQRAALLFQNQVIFDEAWA